MFKNEYVMLHCRDADEVRNFKAWQTIKAELDTQALDERLRKISVVEMFGAPAAPLHLVGPEASANRCAECFAHELCKTLLLARAEKHVAGQCTRNPAWTRN